jgi:hypothetical protein
MDAFITLIHETNIMEVKTPYNELFIGDLKNSIPKNMRTWDGEKKLWRILNIYYLSITKFVCQRYFNNVVVKEIWPVEKFGDSFDELMNLLSGEDKKHLYKAFALRLHPDKGGNTRAMQLVNDIFGK